jgi:hypothetical protein
MVIYPLFICWQVINFHSLSHTGFNPLENMSSSVGMMTFPTEWKVIKFHGSKPPTSIFCIIKPWLNPTSLHLVPWICSSPDSPIDPSPVALVVAPLPPSPVPLAVLRDGRALRPGYCRRRRLRRGAGPAFGPWKTWGCLLHKGNEHMHGLYLSLFTEPISIVPIQCSMSYWSVPSSIDLSSDLPIYLSISLSTSMSVQMSM